jgi:predicted RNase H-like nuclease
MTPPSANTRHLIGIDGCRGGWVIARGDSALRGVVLAVHETIDGPFAEAAADQALVAIDLPIGLPSNGPRACDRAARALLPPGRRASVFAPPCRDVLTARGYVAASTANRLACGAGLSRQSFAILPRIRAVDAALTPTLQARVREAHPEVVFALLALARGHPAPPPKRTAQGQAARLTLLRAALPDLDEVWLTEQLATLGTRRVARDDILDALACLLAAHHVATGRARVLPEGHIDTDARGLRMEIVA